MEAFLKTFEFQEHVTGKDTLETVYKSWDVGFLARKGMLTASKPLMRIKKATDKEDEYYVINRSSRGGITCFRTLQGPMKLDTESEVKRPDGKVFKAKLTVEEENKKLKQVMVSVTEGIPELTVTREIKENDIMELTEECDGNVCKRLFKITEDVESKDDDAL